MTPQNSHVSEIDPTSLCPAPLPDKKLTPRTGVLSGLHYHLVTMNDAMPLSRSNCVRKPYKMPIHSCCTEVSSAFANSSFTCFTVKTSCMLFTKKISNVYMPTVKT